MNLALGGLFLAGFALVAVAPLAAADCSFDYDEQFVGDYRIEVFSGGCDNSWSTGSNSNSNLFVVVHTPGGERIELRADNGRYLDSWQSGSSSNYNYNYNHGLGVMSNVGPQTVRAEAMAWSNGYGASDSTFGWAWCWSNNQANLMVYPVASAAPSVPGIVCTPLFNLGAMPVLPYRAVGDLL